MIARRRDSGFAMVMAIMLMGIVAITLGTMGMTFSLDAQRTRGQAESAQLRQLLLAGAEMAGENLTASDGTRNIEVALPSELEGKLELEIGASNGSGERVVVVDAMLEGRRMIQRLHYVRERNQWNLVAAEAD
jgi:hypothetical protein